jgi:uncharacterized protein YchJ
VTVLAVLSPTSQWHWQPLPTHRSTTCYALHSTDSNKGFAREVEYVRPSSLYKKRKPVRNGPQQTTTKRTLSRSKGKESPSIAVPPIVGAQNCPCGSGSTYGKCCEELHANTRKDVVKAEAILRARYTAYKHGIGAYIVGTSHPKNEDYEKYINLDFSSDQRGRKHWTRDVEKTAAEHDYCGLKVLEANEDIDLGLATVRFQTLLREKDSGSYIATEEVSQFVRPKGAGTAVSAVGMYWQYVNGEVSEPSDEDFDTLLDQFGVEDDRSVGDNDGQDGDPNDVAEQQKSLTPAALAAWKAMKDSQRPVVRDKRGQRRKGSGRGS